MATWSVASGIITLTLDGSESGVFSRSKTFTAADGIEADELHTFYLLVDPSAVPINAFFEVDGGERVVATVVGPHTLMVQGTADGSANITLRFGILNAEMGPDGVGTDGFEQANQAAAEADGYTFVGAWAFHQTDHVYEGTYSWRLAGAGTATRVFTGLTPGASIQVRVDVTQSSKAWYDSGTELRVNGVSGADGNLDGSGTNVHQTLFITGIVTGGGTLTVQLSRVGSGVNTWWDKLELVGITGGGATVDFTDLTYCVGDGVGDGNTGVGGGDPSDPNDPGSDPTPPNDPIPPGPYPPPTTVGDRPFMIFNGPIEGLGYWNGTVVHVTSANIVSVLNKARTNGTRVCIMFGDGERVWKRNVSGYNGTFVYELWLAAMMEVYNNARARAALEAAITDGTAFVHFGIDEPFQKGPRYGGTIPLATLDRMFAASKALWPTWATMITCDLIDQSWYMTRKVTGLDWISSDYMLIRGPCATWRDRFLDRIDSLGYLGAVLGPHYRHFNAVQNGRFITVPELYQYGPIIIGDNSGRIKASLGWKFDTNMVSQPGWNGGMLNFYNSFVAMD